MLPRRHASKGALRDPKCMTVRATPEIPSRTLCLPSRAGPMRAPSPGDVFNDLNEIDRPHRWKLPCSRRFLEFELRRLVHMTRRGVRAEEGGTPEHSVRDRLFLCTSTSWASMTNSNPDPRIEHLVNRSRPAVV
jgi:hypothetical protein